MEPEIKVQQNGNRFRHTLFIEGAEVSSLEVVDLQLRIGQSIVRMGGIANVGTRGEERGKGYSRQLLEQCMRWLLEAGFDCSILFGITDYYQKFGYQVCLPENRIEIATRHAERVSSSLPHRAFTETDLPTIQSLHELTDASQSGSIVREESKIWFRRGSRHMRYSTVEVFMEGSEIVAYLAYDAHHDSNPIQHELICTEFGVDSPRRYTEIVHFLAQKALEMRLEKIAFLCPPQSDIVSFLSLFGAEQQIHYPAGQEGMGRLCHLEGFFTKTLPEWSRRAKSASNALELGEALCFQTEIGSITLLWNGSEIVLSPTIEAKTQIILPQYRLLQFALGYIGAEAHEALSDVQVQGDTRLFCTLFPRKLPYLWSMDHF